MRALTDSDLLDVWERGLSQLPLLRASSLLATAFPEFSADERETLTIGRRDGLLLSLRERTFGPAVNAMAVCDQCQQPVELNFRIDDIRVEPQPSAGEMEVSIGEYQLRVRLPNSRDLAAVMAESHPAEVLFARCLSQAMAGGDAVTAAGLPVDIVEQAIAAIAQADAQADIRLAIECPTCGRRRQVPFDILSFFWREIEEYAIRTLREVHALATAYGWTEDQILALSPRRRRCYLEMAGA
jgi:hypothetical protein